jgi:hypothetical protein
MRYLYVVTALGLVFCGVLLVWVWQINFWLTVYLAIALVFGLLTLVRLELHT